MAGTLNIMLVGLPEGDQELALQHLRAAGHTARTAAVLPPGGLVHPHVAADLIFLHASPPSQALEQLRQLKMQENPRPAVLVVQEASASLALQAWHGGAADLLILPLTPQALDESLKRSEHLLPDRETDGATEVRARLRYLDSTGKEHWAALIPPRFTIGRSTDSDLVFGQMHISRQHAEIMVEGDDYILRDLSSKHGCFVNGVPVEQKRLVNGDRIQLGGTHGQSLTFHHGDLLRSLLSISESNSQAGLSIRGFREMGLLFQTLRALSSIPLLDDLLSLVVDTAIAITGAERGFIMLKEPDGDLSFRCARNNYKQPLDGILFQTSRRVPNEVFETSRRIIINDLDIGDLGDHSSTRQLGVRSIVCVPLRYWAFRDAYSDPATGKVETIGVLYIDSPSIAERLSETQTDALDTLASEAAMAIHNARLYKESLEKRKLEEELAIAREIQQALLPAPDRTLPFVNAFSHNLPCREVGGDYFDYFELEGGKLGFAVGDVAGKGIAAALTTSMLQGIFSAQAQLELPLATLISNVNKNLVKRGPGNRFVTLFFGILDPEGRVTYTNAGHNPPFVVGRDGSIRELTEGGMVLGLFPEAAYESQTVRLNAGDHLVLFTDGVLEARNRSGEEFGDERLRPLLRAHAASSASEILKVINKSLSEFSVDAPQHDDITMMVLGFREDPARNCHAS